MSDTPRTDAVARINEYLDVGGFFNPEILNVQQHEAVRDTLIQARDELNAANKRIKRLEEAVDMAISFCEFHGPVGATPDTADLIAKNLRKAKEAKP